MSDLFFLFRIEKQTTLRALVSGIVPGIQVIMCVKLEQFNDVQVPHMAKEFAPVLQEKLCYCGYWITFHNSDINNSQEKLYCGYWLTSLS